MRASLYRVKQSIVQRPLHFMSVLYSDGHNNLLNTVTLCTTIATLYSVLKLPSVCGSKYAV